MSNLRPASTFAGFFFIGILIFGALSYLSLYYLPPSKYKEVVQLPKGPRHFEFVSHHEEAVTKGGAYKTGSNETFDLLDPELAPDEIKDQVMKGYRIILDTPTNASKFAGNSLSCVYCHFDGGNTFGGKNGGISLVGVSMTYPSYSKRSERMITLEERIQNCFVRSMNGTLPPVDDPVVIALVAYMDWISSPVDKTKEVPWLGLKMLKSKHIPNPIQGEKVFMNSCASCHQADGGGTEGVPPLWGLKSFNDGSGMNQVHRLSSFVYWNMPYQDANLSEEEALDVAAYVSRQPRPHFVQPEGLK